MVAEHQHIDGIFESASRTMIRLDSLELNPVDTVREGIQSLLVMTGFWNMNEPATLERLLMRVENTASKKLKSRDTVMKLRQAV